MPSHAFSTKTRRLLNTTPPITRRTALGLLAAAVPMPLLAAQAPATTSLFDGATLGKWKPVSFGGEGEVSIVGGAIRLERGYDLTGIVWTGSLPGPRFRLEVEARRVEGSDFFAAITVPVGTAHCSLVVGGWGGTVVGFSSLDGLDASENESSKTFTFKDGQWYRLAVEVTPELLQGFVDGTLVTEAKTTGREVDVRIEMNPCRPIGIASWRTTSDIRSITLQERA